MYLTTFGACQLLDAPGGTALLPAGKPLALLIYLQANGGETTRDHLLDLLWANLPPDRGRHALRQTLHSLRRVVGSEQLESNADLIRLTPGVGSDRNDFLEATRLGVTDRVADLYHGPFLSGLAIPGGARFEEWRDEEAQRLHRMWRSSSETAIGAALDRGDHAAAIAQSLQARELDPHHQPFWRLLVGAHVQAGNSRAARHEVEALQHALAVRGVQPQRATVDLIDRWVRHRANTTIHQAHDPLAHPDLVGRTGEFTQLLGAWQHATTGQRTLVHIEGEAGIGKSRLLEALVERLTDLPAAVAVCRAVSGGRHYPFSFLAATLDQLARLPGAAGIDQSTAATLVRIVPTLQSVFPGAPAPHEGAPDSLQLLSCTTDLVRTLMDEQPVTLMLDDLHWADPASLEILGIVVARLEDAPLLMVTTSRQSGGLPGVPSAHIVLAALDCEGIADLLAQLGDVPESDGAWLVGQLADSTAGTPLLLLEALRALLAMQAIGFREGVLEVRDRDAVATALQDQAPVRHRVLSLPSGSRQLLELLAVAGHPVSRALLAQFVPASVDLTQSLETLELAGLAREGAQGWEASHDRYAEAALGELPDDRRSALHRTVARALAHVDGPDRGGALVRALGHAVEADDDTLFPDLARRWIAHQREQRIAGRAEHLLRQFAASAGAQAKLPALRRGLPWTHGPLARIAAVAALVTVLLGGTRAWSWWMDQPASLRLENTPAMFRRDTELPGIWNEVSALLTVRNRRGEISTTLDGQPLHATKVLGLDSVSNSDAMVVAGGSVIASAFQLWSPDAYDSLVATFGVGNLRTKPIVLARGYDHHALSIHSGTVNGQAIGRDQPTVRVAPGERISGRVVLRYDTPTIPVLWFAARSSTFPTTGRDTASVSSLITGATAGTLGTVLDMTAPTQPGSYWLVWAQAAEPSAQWIFSRTNWACGTPIWGDGNDLLQVPDSVLRNAWGGGRIMGTRLLCPDHRPRYEDSTFTAVATVRVIVTDLSQTEVVAGR